MQKGFLDFVAQEDPDIIALQETKMQPDQAEVPLTGYYMYWNSALKKGYSGTAVFTKQEPISVSYGMGLEQHDQEGRVITLEFPSCYFVTVYTPNSQDGLRRLDYRMEWEEDFRCFLLELNEKKPVIVCGDMNVAHKEIDLKNPKTNHMNPGFTDQEREKMTLLLDSGFVDSFRYFYPDKTGAYSWWSYRMKARERNVGWRIDYFLTGDGYKEQLMDAKILSDIYGSDHCPVLLEVKSL